LRVLHCFSGSGYTLLDDEDHQRWKQYRWGQDDGYICADFRLKGNRVRRFYLHRLIAQPTPGQQVHHKNHCRWDNQRANLECLHPAGHEAIHPDGRAIGRRKRAGRMVVAQWDEEQEMIDRLRIVDRQWQI
jgi:hypothetical protein